jgi:hypothetical protein
MHKVLCRKLKGLCHEINAFERSSKSSAHKKVVIKMTKTLKINIHLVTQSTKEMANREICRENYLEHITGKKNLHNTSRYYH